MFNMQTYSHMYTRVVQEKWSIFIGWVFVVLFRRKISHCVQLLASSFLHSMLYPEKLCWQVWFTPFFPLLYNILQCGGTTAHSTTPLLMGNLNISSILIREALFKRRECGRISTGRSQYSRGVYLVMRRDKPGWWGGLSLSRQEPWV